MTDQRPADGASRSHDHTATVIAGVVALTTLAVAGVVIRSEQSAVIVGLVSPTIVALVALLRIEQTLGAQQRTTRSVQRTHDAVTEVAHAVNGDLDRRMRAIAEEVARRSIAGCQVAVRTELGRKDADT